MSYYLLQPDKLDMLVKAIFISSTAIEMTIHYSTIYAYSFVIRKLYYNYTYKSTKNTKYIFSIYKYLY